MKVKELIKELQKWNEDLEIKIDSYGEMTRSDIHTIETDLDKNILIINSD